MGYEKNIDSLFKVIDGEHELIVRWEHCRARAGPSRIHINHFGISKGEHIVDRYS